MAAQTRKRRGEASVRRALQIGKAEAERILGLRKQALRRRARAVAMRRPRALRGLPVDPALKRAVGAAQSAGTLVAEGDSWFDYPLNDILSLLEDEHAYEVESVAHKGDRVEEMAYGGGQLEEFARRLEKLLRRDEIPRAVLLSGGGNDIAGDAFGMLLNHAHSAVAGVNRQILEGLVGERLRTAYVTMIQAITLVSEARLNRKIPILVHGYDYPVPDGRGFLGGWWFLPGPWLDPGFREKGFAIDDMDTRIGHLVRIIDRFNAMLREVCGLAEFAHVKYVNLRGTLSSGQDYRSWWANELHPTKRGFQKVAERFAAVLDGL